MGTDNYKKIIILCSILAAGLVTIAVIYALKKDDPGKKPVQPTRTVDIDETEAREYTWSDVIITGIDLDSSTVSVEELKTGKSLDLIYTGSSDIRTKNMKIISAAMLKKGNIAKVTYDGDNKLESLYGHDRVWSYKNAENIRIYGDPKKIEAGSNIYRYGENLKVINDDEFVGLSTLLLDGTDVVDLYGIDDYVYLIKVNTGHGYLTLSNDGDFLGGTIYYGIGKKMAVDENLNLVLREGEYDISVENEGYRADATVMVRKNETTSFDLAGYGPEPVEYGQVLFDIRPEESDLYVDGVKTDFKEPVSLTCGTHGIEVVLGGYIGYKGTVEVTKGGVVRSITLSPKPTETPDDYLYEDTPSPSPAVVLPSVTISPPPTPTPLPTVTPVPSLSPSGEVRPTVGQPSPTPVITKEPRNPSDYEVGFPDSTTDDGNNGDIEVLDGDDMDPGENVATPTEQEKVPTQKESIGEKYKKTLVVRCSEGTEVYINGTYVGIISGGDLSVPKPDGAIELELRKEGYVTKKYTLTLDDEEDEEVFKFPDMTLKS